MNAKKHILVVEDEHHLAVGIQFNLEAEGYRVTVTGDGRTALKQVTEANEALDLIILDLMLPGMSGYELCKTLRDAGHSMPILILSARTLAEDKARGFDVGANQYLVKPFELDELLSRVKNLITLSPVSVVQNHANHQQVNEFEFSDCKIDFDSFEVTVRDKPVRLTALQMKLLKYFIENEGRVIPRHELLENVWKTPGHVQTRAPDQFMSQLRKTFELNPTKPQHFLTIRDAGYKFVATPNGNE